MNLSDVQLSPGLLLVIRDCSRSTRHAQVGLIARVTSPADHDLLGCTVLYAGGSVYLSDGDTHFTVVRSADIYGMVT